ncbi:MAG: M20/M25/M40 family metallo-hydrolase [Gemmatimonadaceae bacterium]|nr:M20/M25/M40 family metallo-hydrolase [Gemmatimonadaceae bacterium]
MPSRFPLDAVALTEALVAIDSRNPSLVPGAPGEGACAHFLAQVLAGWGFAVSVQDVTPGRPNVLARIGPTGRSPLVLNGHLDVVGTDGMQHPPFAPTTFGDNLYGRGATDMKGGVAAMCVAAARAAARGALASEIIVAAVCDEEYESIGTRALLAQGLSATGAIITEPTRLSVCPTHKGFVWVELTFRGRAAHGSRYDVGIDAVRHAGLVLAAIDHFERTVLTTRAHALLGRPSLHASMIEGGTGWSTYSEHCTLRVERRTIPGESPEQVVAEFSQLCELVRNAHPPLDVDLKVVCAQPPLDLPEDSALMQAVLFATSRLYPMDPIFEPKNPRFGRDGTPHMVDDAGSLVEGLSCWTDAALFQAAGIPALCYGPGDISRAHSANEWVECSQIERATQVLERVCSAWGRIDGA